MEQKDYDLSEQMVSYLCNFVKTGDPNKAAVLPTWIASDRSQKKVLCMGEKDTHMGKPNLLKLIGTMLTNKAVGE
jgi:para-nitrobenzyl esterase